jgi:hypothetical protein
LDHLSGSLNRSRDFIIRPAGWLPESLGRLVTTRAETT